MLQIMHLKAVNCHSVLIQLKSDNVLLTLIQQVCLVEARHCVRKLDTRRSLNLI